MKPATANSVPTDVLLSFVSSLFGNRQTLFTGMLVQILCFGAVYLKSGDHFYVYLTIVFCLVCIYRLYWFMRFDRTDKASLNRDEIAYWETRYLFGGVSTTTLLGIASAYAICILRDPFAELSLIVLTVGSMVSVVGRNYGSSRAVNMQTLSACLPIMISFIILGDPYSLIFAAVMVPFLLTTRSMANGVRNFLYQNVIKKREVAEIAGRFDMALNTMPHGLIMLDAENRILVVNRKACDLMHLGDQERLKDCQLDIVLRYGVRRTAGDAALPGLLGRQIAQLVDGTLSRCQIQFSDDLFLEFSASRRPDGVVVLIFEDVTARVRAERRVLHMVRFDPLTGLPNRQYFVDLVGERLSTGQAGAQTGFMVLDVDEFKHVNDMKGHVAGDRLLCDISAKLVALAGDDAIVGRLMGDQFVLFFPGETGNLDQIIPRIHAGMRGHYDVEGSSLHIGFSAGYVVLDRQDVRMDEWQIKADLALFEAKFRNKGSIAVFESEMDARYIERQQLKADLRQAVADEELSLAYQPMYKPDGSQILCFEALSRWIHPEKGSVPPNVFIGFAEEMGIVSDITRFVIRRACHDCASWGGEVSVSVNLSVQDLRNEKIIDVISQALESSGLAPSLLHLEITESCLMEELQTVCAILSELRAKGIAIAIDDFGTGFSSLSYLDSLPVDIVKIDRSFVRNITGDSRRLKLLRGTVNLARTLGLEIVIEGVETDDQLDLINKYRAADLIQGYIFSAAIAPEKVPAALSSVVLKQKQRPAALIA